MATRRARKLNKKWTIIAGSAAAVVLLALVGWQMYDARQIKSVSNFQECRQSPGSSVLLSYPEVCMTKDKKQFPNPDQHAPAPPVSKATDLTIKEWGVGISIPGQGAYYRMNEDGTAYITTEELERMANEIQGCKAGLHGITIDRNLKEVLLYEVMCMPNNAAAMERAAAIQQDIRNALKSPATR